MWAWILVTRTDADDSYQSMSFASFITEDRVYLYRVMACSSERGRTRTYGGLGQDHHFVQTVTSRSSIATCPNRTTRRATYSGVYSSHLQPSSQLFIKCSNRFFIVLVSRNLGILGTCLRHELCEILFIGVRDGFWLETVDSQYRGKRTRHGIDIPSF